MDNLLAIDIHDDCVSAVLLEYDQKATVVRSYGVASTHESSLAEAVVSIVKQTGYRQGDCRVSVSGERVFFRNLALPFTDRRKLEKVLPFELEEHTSYNLDDFQLDFLTAADKNQGTEIVAAMVRKDELANTLAELDSAGCNPEIVGVGGLQTAAVLASMNPEEQTFVILDISFRQATLLLVENGKIVLVRSLGVDAGKLAGFSFSSAYMRVLVDLPDRIPDAARQLGLLVKQTFLSVGRATLLEQGIPCYICGGVGLYAPFFEQLQTTLGIDVRPCNISDRGMLKIEPIDDLAWNPAIMNNALALGLWKRNDCPILNFRSGAFKKQVSFKKIQKRLIPVAAGCVFICVGLIVFGWWDYSKLSKRRDVLDVQITAVFHEILPDVTRVVNPLQQLKVKINETQDVYSSAVQGRGNVDKLTLLVELSRRIPESMMIRINRLVADMKDVRITAETSDFNTVDNIKRELEKSIIFGSVVISSANLAPQGGNVRFEMKLELK